MVRPVDYPQWPGWNPDTDGAPTIRPKRPRNAVTAPTLEELVGNSPTQRNWRGILIALLVILIVCSLIVVAVILVSPKTEEQVYGEPFTFDDIFREEFKPKHFSAKWVGEKNIYVYRSREGELMEYDADNNSTQVVMDNSTFRLLNTDLYFISEDTDYVLLAYKVKHVYRHSFTAEYVIYNRHASEPKDRLIPFPQGVKGKWEGVRLQYAGWSKTGHSLIFVYNNNLYYQSDPLTTATEVTTSGEEKYIFNGIPDWVYEEEILSSNIAHWWSPEGTYVCYAMINDTNVPVYRFPYYGDAINTYGDIAEIAYPKAGDEGDYINPEFKLLVFDTANPTGLHRQLRPPPQLIDQEHYFTTVTWRDNTHVLISWSNRPQNLSVVTLCDVIKATCHENLVETSPGGKGWVKMKKPLFLKNHESYITMLQERDGSHGFWNHVALVTAPLNSNGIKSFLTQGTWDVTDILGSDEEENLIYYASTNGDPRRRHIFSVGTPDLKGKVRKPECLSCDYPSECQYLDASFSRSGQYYIEACRGPGVPQYRLKSTIDNRNVILEDNAELQSRLDKKSMPRKEYLEIETKSGYKIWAQVFLPPRLNKEHVTQYPLLIYTYGGPGSQQVTEKFHLGWSSYMSGSEKVIYAAIDGRGSGARGSRFLHEVYRRLGTVEIQDQLFAAEYLKKKLSYVDKDRVAIWGWSYGGFVTAHALGDSQNRIPCGVAVAPVTDWRYYDTVYTERYMGLARPYDNYRGYDNANVSRKAKHFKGKHFMIIHGTADDNVHFQNTAQFIKALTEADVDFRIQVYADKNHAISGKHTSKHLYRTITKFLKTECWEGGEPRDIGDEGAGMDSEE